MTKTCLEKSELSRIVDAALSLNVKLEDRQIIQVCDGVKLELYYHRQKFVIETFVDGFWSENIAITVVLKGRYKHQGEPRVESILLQGNSSCTVNTSNTDEVIQAYERQVACQQALNQIARAFLDNKGVLIQKAIELFELEEAEDKAYQDEVNRKAQEKHAAIQVKKDEFAKVNDVISNSAKWGADKCWGHLKN